MEQDSPSSERLAGRQPVGAVFLAFLATRDQAQTTALSVPFFLQQIDVGMETRLTSTLGPGFYCFLGYCLLSILWTQLLRRGGRDAGTGARS